MIRRSSVVGVGARGAEVDVERELLVGKVFVEEKAAAISDAAKRLVDVALSLFGLALIFPFLCVVAILVKLTSRGPIFYCQKRLTCGGKVFTMYKFRTMSSDAEAKSGPVMAARNDFRVIPIGKIMRKTRIDELPQLLNVLMGEMSLVGPRPERPEIAQKLSSTLPQMKRRTEVKPGLTGLAQVKSGYADTPDAYREKLAWDIFYIDNRSLLMDAAIVLQTVGVILTGFGAR